MTNSREEEVHYLRAVKDTSKELVQFLKDIDAEYVTLRDQARDSSSILKNWQQVFGLMYANQDLHENGEKSTFVQYPAMEENLPLMKEL